MKSLWLNKKNNENLIVFFNGWGMDEKVVSHLDCEADDVLIFYDYENFETENICFERYKKKILIAWSMGVYVCNNFYDKFKDFDSFIAVNGTQKPIDDNYGIPVEIYNLTVNNFNEHSCAKFLSKISKSVNLKEYCTRSTQELKNELITIRDLKVEKYLKFNKAIVSTKDRIIPMQNQINYWKEQNHTPIITDDSHYIFDKYKSWGDLL